MSIVSDKIKSKRLSRIAAIQCIYCLSTTEQKEEGDINRVLYEFIESYDTGDLKVGEFHKINQKFFIELTKGAHESSEQIDELVQRHLSDDWTFERLGALIQAIFRIAVFEITSSQDLNKQIMINEYIEIAKLMNHDGESQFVNKVLDSIIG